MNNNNEYHKYGTIFDSGFWYHIQQCFYWNFILVGVFYILRMILFVVFFVIK